MNAAQNHKQQGNNKIRIITKTNQKTINKPRPAPSFMRGLGIAKNHQTMKQKRLFLMLGMAVMLVSCSQDELGGARTDGALTITATVDNGIGTRASTYDSDDVDIDECLLEVYDAEGSLVGSQLTGTPGGTEGTFTFTVSGLDPDAQYDFVFWADSKAAATYGGSLKERKLTDAADLTKALAFQGRIDDCKPADATAVTLTHAVAKVTLKTTGAMTTGDNVTLAMTGIADTWDVLTGTATGTAAKTYTYALTTDIAQPQTDAEVTTFYVPAPALGSTSDITLSYANASGSKQGSTSVTNVPLQANYRTVLKGDVAALFGGTTATITASLDGDWNDQSGEIEIQETNEIKTTAVGQITAEAIIKAAEVGNGEVIIEGPINKADLVTISKCDIELANLDLSKAKVMDDNGESELTEFPKVFSSYNNATNTVSLKKLILPENTVSLAEQCFARNATLETVVFPNTLTKIGTQAFEQCENFDIASLDGITEIGYWAFHSTGLSGDLVVPSSVTTMGQYCFSDTKITSVTWNTTCNVPVNTFTYCENLTSITINAQVGAIESNIANCSGDQDYNPTPAFDLTLTVSTPPSIESGAFYYSTINHIYVPADAVETYKSTSNWAQFKDIITAIQ